MVPENYPRVIIEAVEPRIEGGRFPIKRVVGEKVAVSADIYKEGHDKLAAVLKVRRVGEKRWHESPMTQGDNDRWYGDFTVGAIGRWEYTIEAYAEHYLSWVDEISKKNVPGADLNSELLEGLQIIKASAALAAPAERTRINGLLAAMESALAVGEQQGAIDLGVGAVMRSLMASCPDRSEGYELSPALTIMVNRPVTRFAAWYEFFPRSQGSMPYRHGTLQDSIRRLRDIKAMGFDVVYLPPIHPIGHSFRKGKNNSLVALPGDVGSPWAIGNEHGGHMGLEPQLGTWADWDEFVATCRELGIEIALDYVMNCSPDHPYVAEHPEWFFHRPDGSIKYAENPPKKYQDIVNVNFYGPHQQALWRELLSVILFWVEQGVKIFRVDNPHTKPVPFWEWMTREVRARDPEVIFLAEAFTRPPMLKMMAKVGFNQSYTYFTWRNFKGELIEYLTELTQSHDKEYLRPNFFANTPDINPPFLQTGGRPAHQIRFVLASTLSSVYGIYNGFELCEATPIPGKEEYLNSEKYDYKVWDWDRPGNIKDFITRINLIRRENPALHELENLRFYPADDDNILFYGKMTPGRGNMVFIAVNLDPFDVHEAELSFPVGDMGLGEGDTYQVVEMLTGARHLWRGSKRLVRLDPRVNPCEIYRIGAWEQVDYATPCM